MNTRLPDSDGTHRLGRPAEPLTAPSAVSTPPAHPVPPSALHDARRFMRDRLAVIDSALCDMLGRWHRDDLPPDLLAPAEYPWDASLDEVQSRVAGCHDHLSRAIEHDEDEAARIAADRMPYPDPDIVDAAGLTPVGIHPDRVTWEDVARALLDHRATAEAAHAQARAARAERRQLVVAVPDADAFVPATARCGACLHKIPHDVADCHDGESVLAVTPSGIVVDPARYGWCFRCGHAYAPMTGMTGADRLEIGGKPVLLPTCEHAGDPPVDKSGDAFSDYLAVARRLHHIPGVGNEAGA